ncbi:MAG: hypothetical protein IPL23_07070 [Saprospiraceae bacterium]|nr:hypothetical protein [Saprospiraceae bacterium]
MLLRLFKSSNAICEREINEHIHVLGKIGKLKYDFIDNNHKPFSDWINKHNLYSDLESTQFNIKSKSIGNLFGNSTERKMWIRENIWNKFTPPLIRPFLYFIYRYFIRLGFLDGKIGFIYHFMQGLVFILL